MKSRKEYFHSRKRLMLAALALYALSFFLFQLCFIVPGRIMSLFAIMSITLMFAVISVYDSSVYDRSHNTPLYLFAVVGCILAL